MIGSLFNTLILYSASIGKAITICKENNYISNRHLKVLQLYANSPIENHLIYLHILPHLLRIMKLSHNKKGFMIFNEFKDLYYKSVQYVFYYALQCKRWQP